jgi:hypothetical protein
MDLRYPFRFLPAEEFNKLSQADKIAYIHGATEELKRRGEELREYTRHILVSHQPSTPK